MAVALESLVGRVKRFGNYGPAYEIVRPAREDREGRPQMHIVVPSSGEELDYPLSAILEDPED